MFSQTATETNPIALFAAKCAMLVPVKYHLSAQWVRCLVACAIISSVCAIYAQQFPEAPVDSQFAALPTPASAPVKQKVEGVASPKRDEEDGAERASATMIEHVEDESMVLKRMEWEQYRRRLPADEEKAGHAKLRLRGIDSIRAQHPAPRALPQLEPRAQTGAKLAVGPSADPASPGISLAGQVFGSKWVELGPSVVYNGQPAGGARCKVAGRVTCGAFDPADNTYSTLYLGTAGGGVWKLTGSTWTPLTDSQASLAVGSIVANAAMAGELWVGTGEGTLSADSLTGAGILYSANSGASWTNLQSGTLAGTQIARLAIDRATSAGATNTRRILAATFIGLYATSDGFQTVSLVQSGRFTDVLQDLNNPQVWWATCTSSTGGGLYKSTNNGVTFTQQNTGIPTAQPAGSGLADIVQAPSSPQTMYAVFNGAADYSKLNIYKSTNGGTSWNQIDNSYTASTGSGQFFYNVYVAVNPVNANEIYISGSSPLYRSTNGGSTFTNVASNLSIHPDHQFGMFRPDGARYYDGNDGGLFYTDSPGTANWVSLNTGLGILQVNPYAVALHPTKFEVLCGTQDNGTSRYLGSGVWSLVNFGDGGVTIWDPTDSRYVYNGYVYSTIERSNIQGYGWADISPSSVSFPSSSYNFPFYPKAALNPNNTNMLLLGGNALLRNSAARTGATWTDVSGALQPGHQISAIAFAPNNVDVCYIGWDNGRVYRSGNIAATPPAWTLVITHPNGAYVSDLAVDPNDANHVMGCFYRFSGNQVYEITTADTAPTSTNRSAGFPAIAANCIAVDASNTNVWYIGTEVGVYRTITGGTSWQNYSTGLPNAAVDDLQLDNARSILLAGTHGRGLWMVARPELKVATVTINDSAQGGNGSGNIDPGETVQLTISIPNTGTEQAAGVQASLSSGTPGVTVVQPSSGYPDIPAGGASQANTTAFKIMLDPTVSAGAKLSLTLAISSNSGNFAAAIPIELRAGLATTVLNLTEGFESGFGGFTQTSTNGPSSVWQVDTSKPASGTRCAHFEEPYPGAYQLDQLKSPVTAIPASANRIVISFDHTYAASIGGFAGGKVFLSRDSGASNDITNGAAGVLSIENGYNGTFDGTFTAYPNQDGFVNGGPGLPYSTTALELNPTVWAGHTVQVIFSYNWNGFNEQLNGPTGWFVDNYSVKAENYTIQPVASAADWNLLK